MSDSQAFTEQFSVRWTDLDANRHMRNTVFSEYATHTRFRMLASHGFTQERFEALNFGPVMSREEIRYRREVLFGDTVTVDMLMAGLAPDGSQWKVRQEVARSDGKQAAVLDIEGAWIHLETRQLVTPPQKLLKALQALPKTDDYTELRSVIRKSRIEGSEA